MTVAYTPLHGGETSLLRFKDGNLYWRIAPGDYRIIASIHLPTENVAEFTDLERDLLSSVVRDLGYTPGNIDNI
jgi:hypothetical protein